MLLQAQGLIKRYGPTTVLHGIDLHLDRGEVVGFLGANGAGKSTTMKILAGCVQADGGTATVGGHDLATTSLAARGTLGFLPQEPPLYPDMRVDAYLDHVARLKRIPAAQRRSEVSRVADMARINEVRRQHCGKLSGGYRQRVGLAQALIGAPPLLILDEPTAGLDPAQVAAFRELIRGLAAEHAVLLSTHILAEVEACCARVVVIHGGRNLLADSVTGLRARCASRHRLRVRLAEPRRQGECLAALLRQPWCTAAEELVGDLCCTVTASARSDLIAVCQAHGGLAELLEERQSLEELFRDLIR